MIKRSISGIVFCGIAAAVLFNSQSACAVGTYEAYGSVSNGTTILDSFDYVGSSGGKGADYQYRDPQYGSVVANSAAYVSTTGLHSSSYTELHNLTSGNNSGLGLGNHYQINASSTATAIFSDFTVGGSGTTPFKTSLNFNLNGWVYAGATNSASANPYSGSATVGISVAIYDAGTKSWQTIGTGNYGYYADEVAGDSTYKSGMLANYGPSNTVVTTDEFTVTPNSPLTLRVQLGTNAVAIGDMNKSILMEMNSDFSHTLTFDTTGPVMNLPVGYTLNSADAGIVDNRFSAGAGGGVIPEPATTALTAMGIMGLLVRFNRKLR